MNSTTNGFVCSLPLNSLIRMKIARSAATPTPCVSMDDHIRASESLIRHGAREEGREGTTGGGGAFLTDHPIKRWSTWCHGRNKAVGKPIVILNTLSGFKKCFRDPFPSPERNAYLATFVVISAG